jgi:Holliday junction resolvase RusA-like endonuclease
MTRNIEPFHILIEIPMSLAPVPSLRSDLEWFEVAEEKIKAAAKAAMNGTAPLKGPLSISLNMTYPPGASQRKAHAWRVTAPTTWDLARFILPLLQGVCFVSAGQVAKLEVTKSYGAKALTVITIAELIA